MRFLNTEDGTLINLDHVTHIAVVNRGHEVCVMAFTAEGDWPIETFVDQVTAEEALRSVQRRINW